MPRRYLNLTPLPEALAAMRQAFPPGEHAETVPLREAVGRVTAEPVYAMRSVPEIDIAKFDGYAVKSRETRGAQDRRPLPLTECVRINTGEIIPPSFDAVIMIEDTWDEDGTIRIRKSAASDSTSGTRARISVQGNSSSRTATGSGRSTSVRSRPTA